MAARDKRDTSIEGGYLTDPIAYGIANDNIPTVEDGRLVDSGKQFYDGVIDDTSTSDQIPNAENVYNAIVQAGIGFVKITGNWNAATNTPELESGIGVEGQGYYVNVAGTQTLPFGTPTPCNTRDVVYYPWGGGAWVLIEADKIRTVNGIAPIAGDVTVPISSIPGLGTGIATALGVNVGTDGAPVIRGGSLGTPSGGNLANCTGYLGSNVSGAVATSTTASVATTVTTTATSTAAGFFIPFVGSSSTSNQGLGVDADLSYDPSTNTFSVPVIAATTSISSPTFTATGGAANGTVQIAGSTATEGGQLELGYIGNVAMTGFNSRWTMDVLAGNLLRIFRTDSSGVSITPLTITETTGVINALIELSSPLLTTSATASTGVPVIIDGSNRLRPQTAFTEGSILLAGAGGVYEQDNSQLFWDRTNNTMGIGTNTPNALAKVHVQTSGANGDYGVFINNFGFGAGWGFTMQPIDSTDMQYGRFNSSAGTQIGSIASTTSQSVTAYNTTSDYRLKENLTNVLALEKVLRVPVYELNYKADPKKTRIIQMLAHEIDEEFTDIVTGEKDTVDKNGEIIPQQVNYQGLIPVLWRAVQELSDKIEALEVETSGK
jgi:hypothetical protein